MASVTAPRRRTAWQLLFDRNFGPFTAGKILSSCGNWVQQVAAAVFMFELTHSALMVGTVGAVQFAGPLVLALWTGALTDRHDRRKLLMVGRLVSGMSAGLLPVLILMFGMDAFGGPVVLLLAAAAMGVGHAISLPAMQALTPGLVPDDDLEQALALGSAAPSIARTVGPALGAGLLLLGGPVLAFGVAALTHWVFIAALAMIAARLQEREAARPGVWGGLHYLIGTRAAGLMVLGIALLNFGADPVVTLTPTLADELGGGTQLVGLFASVFGAGAVLVIVLFRQIRRALALRMVAVTGFFAVAIGLLMVALLPSSVGAMLGFLLAGIGFMLATVALNSRIQRRVPDHLRGRVMALWGVAFLGSRPIVAPLSGAIADLSSVSVALLVAAAVVLASAPLAGVRYQGQQGAPPSDA